VSDKPQNANRKRAVRGSKAMPSRVVSHAVTSAAPIMVQHAISAYRRAVAVVSRPITMPMLAYIVSA
jgi:hypothetical protein